MDLGDSRLAEVVFDVDVRVDHQQVLQHLKPTLVQTQFCHDPVSHSSTRYGV